MGPRASGLVCCGMRISEVGAFRTGWGESVVWDDSRQRLWFVDCAARNLQWLDDGAQEPMAFETPGMPTGVVPTDDGRLVVVCDDGLYVVDADAGSAEKLADNPPGLDGRLNDACADLDGNLITGKLNLGPAEGSAYWFSATEGWRELAPDIANTNGPNVAVLDGETTAIIGDTSAHYFAFTYDGASGTATNRRIFGDVSDLPGGPDGATFDADGGLWCALFGGQCIVRFTTAGLDKAIELPVLNPTDVCFGGPRLNRLYVASTSGPTDTDGALLVIDDLGAIGRPEPRFKLA